MTQPDWRLKILAKYQALTDKTMKDMVPIFVDKDEPDSHICGNCSMRIQNSDGTAQCTIVEGPISLSTGTCSWWAYGEKESTTEDIHEARMSYSLSGYVEGENSEFKIQCGTCKFYRGTSEDGGDCTLWMGTVGKGQCCMVYDSDSVHSLEEHDHD